MTSKSDLSCRGPPSQSRVFLKGALITMDDQESSLFHCFIIFLSILANLRWRNDSRTGSRSQYDVAGCDSGPGGHAHHTVQHRDGVWCEADVIPRAGEFDTSFPKRWELGATSGPVWKEDLAALMSGSQPSQLEWQGQLKAHHQAHDPQSQLGNVCDSPSFPVLVTHILNPCIHLSMRCRPLILNQLHHCCRALFIHLFSPMFRYRWPIRGLHVSACRTVKQSQCTCMNITCCMIYIPRLRPAVMTSFI